jgi:hypothetical protein
MSDYPKGQIAKLDAAAAKEAWPLVGLVLLTMAASALLLYVVGEIANRL